MSITIKQAFEKLAMVTGAAVKNPWFVGRNLNQAFADIAANIEGGGGGGSTVEVTQVLESGTKIATITVDDTPTDLYAPAGSSGHNYSTTEQVVGKWIDGSDVYEITLDAGDVPDTSAKTLDNTPANIAHLISVAGFAYSTAQPGNDRPLPFCADSTNPIRVDLTHTTTNKIRITTYTAWTGYKAYVTIRYTKSSS